jgi:hypothetical protein
VEVDSGAIGLGAIVSTVRHEAPESRYTHAVPGPQVTGADQVPQPASSATQDERPASSHVELPKAQRASQAAGASAIGASDIGASSAGMASRPGLAPSVSRGNPTDLVCYA